MLTSKLTLYFYLSLFILYNFLLITPSLSSELCNPNDKAALIQIKQSFGNPYILTSWTNDTDCCVDWYLIECDRTTHRIITLSIFTDDRLHGTIPDAVGNLPFLQELTMRKLPNLTGPVPVAITKLKNLRSLRLDYNSLTGPIPSFLNKLTKLYNIDLSFNKFSGSIPPSFALLPNLYEIYLSRNMLTGSIPKSLFNSFKLSNVTLDLSHNQLSGPIPRSLGNVYQIYLSRNKLTGDPSSWFRKRNARVIDLSRNMVEFNFSTVQFNSNLEVIDLNHNKIYGSIPSSLAGLSRLQFFNVSYNRLCGKIPTGGQLSQFDQYSFFHNRCLCGSPLPRCK